MLQSWASEREFYIGGSTLLCQFIEPVTRVHCAFIFALRNITLGGYLETHRKIYNIYGTTVDQKYIYIYIAKFLAIEQTSKLASLAIIVKRVYAQQLESVVRVLFL